jgi:CheY-like chemotaxis protein
MQTPTNLHILIVDDNPDIHTDFIKILTANSAKKRALTNIESQLFGENNNEEKTTLPEFHIETATQGQEGVEKIAKAKNEGNPFALAFVDIRMPPGWDGIETIQHIWEIDNDIQIVICTAYSDYTWEETVDKLGQRENLLILKKHFDHVAVRQLSCALKVVNIRNLWKNR